MLDTIPRPAGGRDGRSRGQTGAGWPGRRGDDAHRNALRNHTGPCSTWKSGRSAEPGPAGSERPGQRWLDRKRAEQETPTQQGKTAGDYI